MGESSHWLDDDLERVSVSLGMILTRLGWSVRQTGILDWLYVESGEQIELHSLFTLFLATLNRHTSRSKATKSWPIDSAILK